MKTINVPTGGNLLAVAIAAAALVVAVVGTDELGLGQEKNPTARQAEASAPAGSGDGEEGGEPQKAADGAAQGGEGAQKGAQPAQQAPAGTNEPEKEARASATPPRSVLVTAGADTLHTYPNHLVGHGRGGEMKLYGSFWLPTRIPPPPTPPAAPAGPAATPAAAPAARTAPTGTAGPQPGAAPPRPAGDMGLRLYGLPLVDTVHGRELTESVWTSGRVSVPRTGNPAHWALTLRDVPAGQYHGYVLARPDSAGYPAFLIPVSLTARHGPLGAFIILFMGVCLVFYLRYHRNRHLDRDQAWMRIDRAQATIVSDPEIAKAGGIARPFRHRFAELLTTAARSLQGGGSSDVTDAQQTLDRTDELWRVWNDGRRNWVSGLQLDQETIARLTTHGSYPPSGSTATHHADTLLSATVQAYESAPGKALSAPQPGGSAAAVLTAEAYSTAAGARWTSAGRYADFLAELEKERANGPTGEEARKKLFVALDAALEAWQAADPPKADEIRNEHRAKIRAAKGAPESFAAVDARSSTGNVPLPSGYVQEEWGELLPVEFQRSVQGAHNRWRTYASAVTMLVAAMLALLGLKETWGDNPTFGADPLSDYLAVAIWALGINVASLVVWAAFIREWKLPWLTAADADAPEGRGAAPASTTAGGYGTTTSGGGTTSDGSTTSTGSTGGGGNTGDGGNSGGGANTDAGGGTGGQGGGSDDDHSNAERARHLPEAAWMGPVRQPAAERGPRLRRL